MTAESGGAAVILDLRARATGASARIATLPRRPWVSVLLAACLLALPLAHWQTPAFGLLTVVQVEGLAALGLVIGWAFLDGLRSRQTPAGWSALAGAAIAVCGWLAWSWLGMSKDAGTVLVVSFVLGGLVRGRGSARSMTTLVVVAAVTTWLAFDFWHLPHQPLRDIQLYLGSGAQALGGSPPYLTSPITSIADTAHLPFVYPPFTIPLFETLARMPTPIAEVLWVGASVAAVVAAFWLLGVRGRWLAVLLAWPVVAQGIVVGNVASFTFFLYALGFRVGAALVLSGMFKFQSMIPILWLVVERRWRQLIAGIGIIALIVALSIPVVGPQTWLAWPGGLRLFQEGLAKFPVLEGTSLVRGLGPMLALVVTAGAVGFAFLARGRNALARYGLASVAASPTLYLHGLSPLLAGMLVLGPELVWFTLGLGPWKAGAWITMAIVGLALFRVDDNDLRTPGDLSPARADLHPAGRLGQVWPR